MLFLSFISGGDGEVGRGLIWKANNHILGDGELEMQGNLQMARKHGVKARTEKPQTVPGSGCNSRRRRKEGGERRDGHAEWTQNEKTRERQAAPRERGARPKRRWEHGQLHFRCQYTSRDLNYCIISINNSFSYLYILKKYTEMWVKIYLYKDVPFGGFYNNKTQQKLNSPNKRIYLKQIMSDL